MNTLIVYDSLFGNTRKIAQVLAENIDAFFPAKLIPVREANLDELQGVKLFLLGSPTHEYNPTPAIQTFLEQIPRGMLQSVIAAAFDTRYRVSCWSSGSAAWSIAQSLQEAGAVLALPPESFFVSEIEGPLEEGETERAAQWAQAFLQKAKTVAYV